MSEIKNKRHNRILFSAPKSGSGKTMVTCAFIAALKKRGIVTAAFKCGPDYIDPMFHRNVLGVESGNLDTFFTDAATTAHILSETADRAELTVIEGVMGYYDGLGGVSDEASTYEVACVTHTPVCLVVDGKGASVSLAAVIKGLVEYREDSNIKGIILNRVSKAYYDRLKTLIEKETGIRVYGFIPELRELAVPSRHLGLVSPEEMREFSVWVERICGALEESVDIDGLIALACSVDDGDRAFESAGPTDTISGLDEQSECNRDSVSIAVARDEAFSFYYSENLSLLKKLGARIVEFSPLRDDKLPEGVSGLILGGGYPELYAKELEANESMRSSIAKALASGMPCFAECGGFMYLQEQIEDNTGSYSQAGVLDGRSYPTDRLCRFGYIELETKQGGLAGPAGTRIRAHEFHYCDSTENGADCIARKPIGDKSYDCMINTATIFAGFPHLYYYSNPDIAKNFVRACIMYQSERNSKRKWDKIAKPIDSLGLLEDAVARLAAIKNVSGRIDISRRALLTMCADHGVVAEGVTQTDSSVTKVVSENFAKGSSTVNNMARLANVDVYALDVGIDTDNYPEKRLVTGSVVDRKVARGTSNLALGAAMTRTQCEEAINVGLEAVKELKQKGYDIVLTGEMGIGNTTPTGALACLLTDTDAKSATGRGAGLSDSGLEKKIQVIEKAVERVRTTYGIKSSGDIHKDNMLDIMSEVGGLELAAMCGVFLGGVRYGMPVVIDGAISAISALAAYYIDKRVGLYALASHVSHEHAGQVALERLGVKAPITAGMCLGEGTGAVALMPLLDMACEVYNNMGTFEEYSLKAYKRDLN